MKTLVENAERYLKEDIEETQIGRCKECMFWSRSYENECDNVGEDDFLIRAEADDDSGLDYGLITGPNFGCVKFESKIGE